MFAPFFREFCLVQSTTWCKHFSLILHVFGWNIFQAVQFNFIHFWSSVFTFCVYLQAVLLYTFCPILSAYFVVFTEFCSVPFILFLVVSLAKA